MMEIITAMDMEDCKVDGVKQNLGNVRDLSNVLLVV